jgi:nucleoside-diphosphate-sugar epimerase
MPINIGNPDERTILEISKLIQNKIGVKLENEYVELPQDDPKKRFPDISLAKKLMNWEPKVPLEIGLDYTIEYFENIMKGTT